MRFLTAAKPALWARAALCALAIGLGRGALRHDDMRLGRAGGRTAARLGRALGVLGISLASTCAVALAVYGILTYLGER